MDWTNYLLYAWNAFYYVMAGATIVAFALLCFLSDRNAPTGIRKILFIFFCGLAWPASLGIAAYCIWREGFTITYIDNGFIIDRGEGGKND